MSRIFISHSSANNLQAVAVGQWLGTHGDNGWDDYFLDLDPTRGLKAGERWQEALRTQGERCEAVIFLISKAWLASEWCRAEFIVAKQLNKKIFGVKIEDIPTSLIPTIMSAEWQLCNLAAPGETETIAFVFEDKRQEVRFSREGLARLKNGLEQAGIDPRTFTFPAGRKPYRGLKPLEAEDAAIFFGRDAEILRALDRIRGMRNAGPEKLMIIIGASGSGKSSFLRAGLLRRLKRDDRNFLPLDPIRPAGKAITGNEGMAASLEAAYARLKMPRSLGSLIETLSKTPKALADVILELRDTATKRLVDPSKPVTVVLHIDQGEELLDQSDEITKLIELLTATFNDKRLRAGGLIAIMTVRSDRFENLQKHEGLRELPAAEFGLPPVATTSYREIVERPATIFETSGGRLALNPDLIDAIVTDAAKGGADALPILAFTLERLYSLYGKDGDLTLEEYDKLGRMEGAIAAAVNEAIRPTEQHKLRRAFIPHLAAIDPKSLEPHRRKAKLGTLPEEAWPLIEKMVDTRLLVADKLGEDIIVELAHDSLFKAWDDLRGWLQEDRDLLALGATVSEAAEAWDKNRRPDDRLAHRGTPLKEAETLLARPDLIEDLSREYLSGCRRLEMEEADRKETQEREKREALEREQQALDRERQALQDKRRIRN